MRLLPLASVRRGLLAAVLAVPPVILGGCAEPSDETASSEEALSGREYEQGAILRVTADSVSIRSRASSFGWFVTSLDRDDLVTVAETSGTNGWVNVRSPDGDVGWAQAKHFTLEGDGPDPAGEEASVTGETCHATDRALTSTEFSNVMSKISYEWASLPPGRYGQPMKPMSELRTLYCTMVDC